MDTEASVSAFRAIWVAPSIILGMGMTRLFSDVITLFRSRHNVQIDWIPLVWALCIFIWQIQYLWAIIELPSFVQVWTLLDFILLLFLSLSLYVSAALILPDFQMHSGARLEDNFLRDGRWSLIALSTWGVTAALVDVTLYTVPVLSPDVGWMIAVAVVPLVFLAVRGRIPCLLLTWGNLLLTLWAAWMLSPKFY